jgi:uncharacterized protein YdeI (YjbR/CyaY-like superfamily)
VKAWENFRKLAPSYRRSYIGWLSNARRPATFDKRLRKSLALLRANKKLGLV